MPSNTRAAAGANTAGPARSLSATTATRASTSSCRSLADPAGAGYDATVSTRPQPERYRTRAEYAWAMRLWRRRTGGSLITTAALALIVGGLSGSPLLAMVTLAGALALHLHLRRTR